jgi:hypothetical protein
VVCRCFSTLEALIYTRRQQATGGRQGAGHAPSRNCKCCSGRERAPCAHAAHLCTQDDTAVGQNIRHPYLQALRNETGSEHCPGMPGLFEHLLMTTPRLETWTVTRTCTRAPLLQLANFKLSSNKALDKRCFTSGAVFCACPEGSVAVTVSITPCLSNHASSTHMACKSRTAMSRKAIQCKWNATSTWVWGRKTA